MKKELIRKICLIYGICDTRKYRYRYCGGDILRIDKDLLGTTAARNGWKKVYTFK